MCHAYSPSITVHFYLPNLWISSYSSLIFLSLSSATFTSSIIPIMFTIHYISGTYLCHAHTSVSCFPSTGSARNSVYPPVNNTLYNAHIIKNQCAKTPVFTLAKSAQKSTTLHMQPIDYQSLITHPQKIKSAQNQSSPKNQSSQCITCIGRIEISLPPPIYIPI